VLASHIFGPKQEVVDSTRKRKPRTYKNLYKTEETVESAAVEQFESMYPYNPSSTDDNIGLRWAFGRTMTSQYFCIPYNEKLQDLRTKIDDRMYKIRNSMDINGNFRILGLFEPEIDPGQLIRANLAGNLNLQNAIDAGNGTLIHIRFSKLISRAIKMCRDLTKFGTNYLQILQMKDNGELATFLSSQDYSMQQLQREIKALALQGAKKTMESIKLQRKKLESRLSHFLALVGEKGRAVPTVGQAYQELENTPPSLNGRSPPMTDEEMTWFVMKTTSSAVEVARGVITQFSMAASVIPDVELYAAFVS
jgi:hypothetical protein